SLADRVLVAGGCDGRETEDRVRFDGHERSGARRIEAGEIIMSRTIFRTQSLQVLVRHQTLVGDLPRAHVNPRHGHRVVGNGGSELHEDTGGRPRPPNASSSALVSGLRKNDSAGINRASMPCRRSVSATTGPTAATSVLASAALAPSSEAIPISRSICEELVKAMASTPPSRSCRISVRTACSSAASAYT